MGDTMIHGVGGMDNVQIDERIYCYSDGPEYRVLTRPFHALGHAVPAGFRWDGASTPAAFRWLIPKFHQCLKASCLHDYRCRTAKNAADRKAADNEFMQMLISAENMGAVRAWFGWLGVRVGAWWGTGVHYPHFVRDHVWPLLGV